MSERGRDTTQVTWMQFRLDARIRHLAPHKSERERKREREREREKGQQGAVDGQVQQSNKIDSNTYFSDSWTQPRHGAKVERERERQCV